MVGPGTELPIELSFGPSIEKLFNFNVELRVKNKPTPLAVNVKGEGYSIHDTLLLEDAAGRPVEISAHAPTQLDFGEVHIHDKVVRTLTVVNSGRFNFDVALHLRAPDRAGGGRAPPVTVTPELLTVKKNERAEVQIVYQPMSDAPLPANFSLAAAITNGRTYHMQLLGRGKRPRLSFSFGSHDFGPCFVVTPKNGMAPVTIELRLANEDEHEVYFDMPFSATPFLSASASKTVLAPGETSEVLLTFSPPAVAAYEAALSFVVNGLWNVEVKVRGEGCELKLELVEPQQQQLALGAVPVYQQAARTVALVNRSRRAIDVSLLDAAAALAPKSVHLSFGGGGALEGELRPRESRALEVRFAPAARIRPFSEPVVVTVCGLPRPLLVVSGACVAMDLQLEMDQVAFGQAVLNSRITRRLMLQNLGDMPSRFNVQGAFAPDFSVSPLEGFLQPNEDVNIEVSFHPAALSRDIRHANLTLT